MAVPTRASEIIVGNLVPLIVGSVFVLARFYSRAAILRRFQVDDYILLVAWLASLVNTTEAIVATHHGEGRHQIDILPSDIVPFFQLQYGSRILYQLAISTTKISLCVMYLRIFGTVKASRVFLWITLAILIASFIALEAIGIFQCIPIASIWDFSIKGKCINDTAAFWVSSVVSIVTDVALLVFSAWKIKGLQMRPRQKAVLLLTVGIGWVVVLAAIIRAVRIAAVIKDSSDASWRAYDTSIWSAVEINVGLLCTSAPAIKPLLQKMAPKFMYSISGGPTVSATNAGAASGRKTATFTAAQSRVRASSMTHLAGDDNDKDIQLKEGGIFKSTSITVTDRELV